MELWIRSQDKEKLVKCNDITIRNKNVETTAEDILNNYKINGYEIVGYFDKETEYEILGSYATKERALEVLDDIQKILTPQKIIKTIDNSVKIENAIHIFNPTYETIQQLDSYVYEMPKE